MKVRHVGRPIGKLAPTTKSRFGRPIGATRDAMKPETDKQLAAWHGCRFHDAPAARRPEPALRGTPEPNQSQTGCALG